MFGLVLVLHNNDLKPLSINKDLKPQLTPYRPNQSSMTVLHDVDFSILL